MGARDYPIRHFDEMKRLAEALDLLPAQILKHTYSYLSSGSWTLTFRCKERLFRLSFDGRANRQLLERSTSEHSPHKWAEVWRQTSLNDAPAPEIIGVIVHALEAG